ncbi:MAG: hypothetical protein U1F11_14870 [Steroidobacteraceae bacterium]
MNRLNIFGSMCASGGGTTSATLGPMRSRKRFIAAMSIGWPKERARFSRSSVLSFSVPTASATSARPAPTWVTARLKAVVPPAQAFSTLNSGPPWMPIARSACWPFMPYCSSIAPPTVLA